MTSIYKTLGLDYRLNRNYKTQDKFNSVWLETNHNPNYNEMCDLIELPDYKGYKYLFTITDLYNFNCDFEPIKNKTAEDCLTALKTIFKRGIVKLPYASLQTDGGNEFKGIFHKFLYNDNIYQRKAQPYRHTQQGVIEGLNGQITKVIMLYLNKKSKEKGKQYNNWIEILPELKKYLNEIRHKKFLAMKKKYKDYRLINQDIQELPKFKIGEVVHYKLDYPENWNMQKAPTPQFRNGDYHWSQITRKIKQIINMNSYPWFRYILEGMPNVSFSEYQLLKAKSNYSTYKVKKIIGEKTINRKKHYLVWWAKHLKRDATYEPEKNLIEDGLTDYIDAYKQEKKEKLQKEREKIRNKSLKS